MYRLSVPTARSLAFLVPALALPFTLAARGDGCAANSTSPAPDVTGDWAITYDDRIAVEVDIGGAHYEQDVPATGGTIEIVHDGRTIDFDLDCARPEVVCPSEAWPDEVAIEQRNVELEHRMIVTLPTQSCDGTLRAPSSDECGDGTLNPDCDSVCDGDIRVGDTERFGVIGEEGDSFRLYLGAGIATNGPARRRTATGRRSRCTTGWSRSATPAPACGPPTPTRIRISRRSLPVPASPSAPASPASAARSPLTER